jgi:hypothetical protein
LVNYSLDFVSALEIKTMIRVKCYRIFGTDRLILSFADDRQKYGDLIILYFVTETSVYIEGIANNCTMSVVGWGDHYAQCFES